ncbi:hypothetical protein [Streptomyces sp. NBC_01481]|uniref:hypothetical protein n=1 Tax=Streptomyces sp. NBC_01481 TaxID=2975869 RepID=UPI0022587764|nr:hypothetical protein [Streptomyces sp. NBC_01481]MCX4584551.1 hypothetical protein [Streptomyces sp. NBC_01481]
MATWSDILEEARQDLGFTGDVVPRNLKGIRAALKPERLADLDAELSTLSEGAIFEAFLDDWWAQALVDSASGPEDKEQALDFADLSISLRNMRSGGQVYTHAEVEAMLKDIAS